MRQRAMARLVRPAGPALLLCVCFSAIAQGKDVDAGDSAPAKAAAGWPNIYLDLRTYTTTVPAGALALGFNGPSISTVIATLANLRNLTTTPALPTLASPSSQNAGIDVPLTVDVNDRISLFGGFSATASRTAMSGWSTLSVTSWFVGFQADVHQQNGGSIPTITLLPTVTRSVPDSPLATTSLNIIAEANYALNEDETAGLLGGVQYTRVDVDAPRATFNPTVVGYVGGYYQWDNNWKFSGRAGVQSFGGAQLLNLTPFQPYTQPILRLDIDRMDDNDNRLFGVTAQIMWVPKPSYQLTVRTPLYAVRN